MKGGTGFAMLRRRMTRTSHSSVAEARGQSASRGSVRQVVLALVLLWLAAPALLARSDDSPGVLDSMSAGAAPAPAPTGDVLPAVARPFRPGERLKFKVEFGPIHAGTAWLEVHGNAGEGGRNLDTLQARAQSNTFFNFTYRVMNRIESVWDADQRMSWRYREDRREGGYRAHDDVGFDHEHGEAHYVDGRIFPIPPHVQDALSSFYYTRTLALPVGGSVFFDYHASHRSQPLEVRVLGRDRVKVPAGTFDCVIVEPVLRVGGIFKNSGRLMIWLTADDRRVPVQMRSKLAIGSITVQLQDLQEGS
jgi:hypothetical protein